MIKSSPAHDAIDLDDLPNIAPGALTKVDVASLSGPDGPTHHGVFDLGYMRVFPNMVVMAPGDANDLPAMIEFSLKHGSPCSMRYPKATAESIDRESQPIVLGESETLSWGEDGIILVCGTLLSEGVKAGKALLRPSIKSRAWFTDFAGLCSTVISSVI